MFRNCIFWGENGLVNNEVDVIKNGNTTFNVDFDRVLWKVQTTPQNITSFEIINNQDRGLFVVQPNRWPDPTGWTFEKTSWFADRYATANSGNFLLPLPASEVSQAPSLKEEPVPYEFAE